jgi:aryl sulfotransferase
VVVTTSYKSGTTWTQLIVLCLLQGARETLPSVRLDSPWPDRRFGQTDADVAEHLARCRLQGALCLKSHLPLDGLPWHPEVRYLVVGRDPRDVFMSLFNHYGNYTDARYVQLNDTGRNGDPLPRCPEDPRALWQQWMSRGWFPWEQEGWPFWSNLGHTRSYWEHRALDNLLFVHFDALRQDPVAEIARIAGFIGVDAGTDTLRDIAAMTHFDNVKQHASKLMPDLDRTWKGGADAFFFKGEGGRWRGVLQQEDLALYEDTMARVLEPGCARWLENGGDPAS